MRSSRRRNDIRRERSPIARRYPNPYLEFDDEKIQSRALRFGLANSTTPAGTSQLEKPPLLADDDLLNLYIRYKLLKRVLIFKAYIFTTRLTTLIKCRIILTVSVAD